MVRNIIIFSWRLGESVSTISTEGPRGLSLSALTYSVFKEG